MKLKELGGVEGYKLYRGFKGIAFRDLRHKAHFTKGPAYIWEDGGGSWYIHGKWIKCTPK